MSSGTCKTAVVEQYTGDVGRFTIAELEMPRLRTPTSVKISVHSAALNPIDFKRAEGMLALVRPEPFPLKLGYDVAGEVTEVGSEVTRFQVGDKVYGRVQSSEAGTIAEYVVTEEFTLAPIPSNVPYSVAAAVPLAGLTALQALERAQLKPGQSLFVSGGMGGVGMFGVMLGKHHFKAAEVITTVSPAKVGRAKQLGATRTVDYTAETYTSVLENAADVVLDTIGDSDAFKVAKPGGQAVSVAMLPDGQALELFRHPDIPLSVFGTIKLALAKQVVSAAGWVLTRGFRRKNITYQYVVMRPDGQALEEIFNPLLSSETIKPVIANVRPFTIDGVQAAFKESSEGHAAGKIIICVRD
ncbi:hypothetical protein GGF46_004522 [Coemansia sp. RSA 552]|nr:hypothetical protein GGF46_004522 [Coemansia sp. RSA 552]